MPRRLEPLHPSLSLTQGLVGVLGAIVQIGVLPMLQARQELPLGRPIAGRLVGTHYPRHIGEPLEQLAEGLLRGSRVPVTSDQGIKDVAATDSGAHSACSKILHPDALYH
jgi:hypothetical protein